MPTTLSTMLTAGRRYTRTFLRRVVGWHEHGRLSYSQEGEDVLISRLLGLDATRRYCGFYVDVGAHDPFRYSNTAVFYRDGWSGINIDPRPNMKRVFDRVRPRDVNLEIAISSSKGQLDFLDFSDPTLSGTDVTLALKREACGTHKVVSRRTVEAKPLRDVLMEHAPSTKRIDFLSVDVEGHDAEVLASSDWKRWRPRLVLAEDASVFTAKEALGCNLATFMAGVDYTLVAKLALTQFFAPAELIDRTPYGLKII